MNFKYKLLSVMIAGVCTGVMAQENIQAATNNSDVSDLGTITVTARGISEDSLRTPFAIKIIDGSTIADKKLTNARDLLRTQAANNIHEGGNVVTSTLWMRGIGSLMMTSLDDNSVDFRIDGISNGKTGLARNLLDVERVEIAKGPQGTLMGSGAEAGSFNIKTIDPEDEFDIHAGVGVGNHNLKEINAMVNVPMDNNIALRVAAMSQSKDNDFIKREDGRPLTKKEKKGIQLKLGWHDDADNNSAVLGLYHDNTTGNVPVLQKEFDHYKVATANLPHSADDTAKGINLTVKSDVGFADFTSITGYHHFDGQFVRPGILPETMFGAFPEPVAPTLIAVFSDPKNNTMNTLNSHKQLSQEFRLASQEDADIKWVSGLYFAKKKRQMHVDSKIAVPTPFNGTFYNGDTDKSWEKSGQAIFGEVTVPAVDKLEVIAGARVAHEKLDYKVNWSPNTTHSQFANGAKSDHLILSDTAVTGRLGLSYAITPEASIYALQSRGYKFGDFDDFDGNIAIASTSQQYKPSVINASEIGVKVRSANQRLTLGVAAYQNRIKDDRIRLTDMRFSTTVGNADTVARGLELSGDWQISDMAKIYGEVAFAKTKVTKVSADHLSVTQVGNEKPQAPRVSGSIGITLGDEIDIIKDGNWFADVNYRYVGSRYAQPDNKQKLGNYGIINASVGIANDHHRLMLWGNNLTNEKYLESGVKNGIGVLGAERSFGLQYSYQF
ncbi:MAG: hypothetical protein CR975_04990 [Gammaproteobacteria bacterium]|nr:MAG: hypothetical protein CR975_04990 [Gammaproteobacteria bacterium]